MTTALLDRLTHHCEILETGNDSWHFKTRAGRLIRATSGDALRSAMAPRIASGRACSAIGGVYQHRLTRDRWSAGAYFWNFIGTCVGVSPLTSVIIKKNHRPKAD